MAGLSYSHIEVVFGNVNTNVYVLIGHLFLSFRAHPCKYELVWLVQLFGLWWKFRCGDPRSLTVFNQDQRIFGLPRLSVHHIAQFNTSKSRYKGRRRLAVCDRGLYRLVDRFRGTVLLRKNRDA